VCIDLCPYSAIEFDERRQIAVINEAMCKGCGSCAGYCPSGAAQIKHFNESQIFNEIDGLLGMMPGVSTAPPGAEGETGGEAPIRIETGESAQGGTHA
jgi:heterodisulfide reductase subunit A